MRRERDRRVQSGRSSPSLAPLLPAIWHEPNALDTLSGGRLAQAYDLSGNSRYGVQGAAGSRPLLVVGAGPGGRDCWRFVPARPDFYEVAHDAGIGAAAWTVFFLIKCSVSSTSLFSKGAGGLAQPIDLQNAGTLNLGGELAGASNFNSGTWRAIGARRDIAGNQASIWIDGAIDATSTISAFGTGTSPVRIGQRADGYGPFDGDIAHICAWNRALTTPEIAQVHSYFAARFGL